MKPNILLCALATLMVALGFSACSSDDGASEPSGGSERRVINLTSSVMPTRTTNNVQTTQISSGVEVGVYGLNGGATIANGDNARYTADGSGALAADATMTWPQSGTLTVYAYAPYQSGWNYASDTKLFTVAADQHDDAGYLQSDLIYASANATTQSTIPLGFTHKMARLMITLNTRTDLSAATVKVLNTLPSVAVDITTGTLGTATGSATPIIVGSNIQLAANGSVTLYAAVVPQTIDGQSPLVEVTDGEASWKFNFSEASHFDSGSSYSLTVTAGVSSMSSGTSGSAALPALSPKSKNNSRN